MSLAKCYVHSVGGERDATKAVELRREALQADGTQCIKGLARCQDRGLGVEVGMVKVGALYKRGAEFTANTCKRAIFQAFYGLCLIPRKGVAQNVKKGWENKSSAQVDTDNGLLVQRFTHSGTT